MQEVNIQVNDPGPSPELQSKGLTGCSPELPGWSQAFCWGQTIPYHALALLAWCSFVPRGFSMCAVQMLARMQRSPN